MDNLRTMGLTLSSDSPADQVRTHYSYGLGWTQVYVTPGTTRTDLEGLARQDHNYLVHAAHETHGFNFFDGRTDLNVRTIDEATEAAYFFGAKYAIFHPPFIPKEFRVQGKGISELLAIDEKMDELVEYIRTQLRGVSKPLIENMPKVTGEENPTFFNFPVDAFFNSDLSDFGFCLDTNSLALARNSPAYGAPSGRYHFPGDISTPLDRLDFSLTEQTVTHQLRLLQDRMNQFIDIHPEAIHMRGTGPFDQLRFYQTFSPFNAYQLATILPYCITNEVPLILEVPQNIEMQRQAIAFVRDFAER